MSPIARQRFSAPVRITAGALVLLLFLIGSLAARPDWHAAFHQFATSPDHGHSHLHSRGGESTADPGVPAASDEGCAVDLYASGGISLTWLSTPDLRPTTVLIQLSVSPDATPVLDPSSYEPPGRAPPALL